MRTVHPALLPLTLRCRGVVLRPVREADLPRLAAVLPADVGQDPSLAHLAFRDVAANRRRILVQGVWRSWADWTPESWALHLAVEHDGELVGVQTLEGDGFARLRTVDSASWLVPSARGRGVGVAMRTAVLGLAFDHLGAEVAITSAVLDNAASLGVSRRLGYVDNGVGRVVETTGVAPLQHLRLERAGWRHGHEVDVEDVEAWGRWFGVAP